MSELGVRFGANLKAMRESAGLSQEDLADRAEVHRTQISTFETGKNCPSLEAVVKLAGGLGVDYNKILSGLRWVPLPVNRAAIVRGTLVLGLEDDGDV